MPKKQKIGIYAGTFNPVHEGHVSLMRQAIDRLDLDRLYCLPDRRPPYKKNVMDFAHREALLKLALSDIAGVEVVRSNQAYASFPETIEELDGKDADVYILIGSDAALALDKWRNAPQLTQMMKFAIGVRGVSQTNEVGTALKAMGVSESRYSLIQTPYADYSSTRVRKGQQHPHPKIRDYIRKHQLYKV